MKCEATFVGLETGYTYSACARTAKVEVDGKHYCGIHDPIKRKAKEAQRGAIVDVRTWISTARWAIDNHRTKLADWALNTLSANHPLIVEWRNLQAEKDAAERRLAELDRPPGAPAAQEKRYWVDIWPDAREIVACNVDRVHMEMRDLGVLWIRLDHGEDAQVIWVGAERPGVLEVTTQEDEATLPAH